MQALIVDFIEFKFQSFFIIQFDFITNQFDCITNLFDFI